MKISIIAGARPNFMKIAPIMRAIHAANKAGRNISARLIYTGSDQDKSLEPTLFSDLDMPAPDTYLHIESTDFFHRMAGILVAFSSELEEHPTDLVMVVDDLTPTMACSIVARKKNIKIAHLVAGIRSFDMNSPKELNRMIADGLSDILFTAGMDANRNLNHTGTEQTHVHFVGNILIDSLRHNHTRLQCPEIIRSLGIKEKEFILLTLNRRVLLEDELQLKQLFQTILAHSNKPIIAPLHRYVQDKLELLGICSDRLHLLPPQPYLAFCYLTNHAYAIITDSGNVAEEATFLGIPCMTLNDYAEHPETVHLGTNCLVGNDLSLLAQHLDILNRGDWKKGQLPERWDGRTAERIIQTLLEEHIK
ncbi:MAG: UDP-N-acetylglucosamine 2-epimerase (non-hydrolyzing) [Bacteroidaceae bacterium]|nr:UDP-N-acetylglucosamine 2-epimerase (non-hydrolyzing) [Bacteroidaceae bacterium]